MPRDYVFTDELDDRRYRARQLIAQLPTSAARAYRAQLAAIDGTFEAQCTALGELLNSLYDALDG